MFCPPCGSNLSDDMDYCPICGTAQHAGQGQKIPAEPIPPIPPVPPIAPPKARRSKKKIVMIVITIMVAIAVVISGAIIWFQRFGSPQEDLYYMSRCLLTADGDSAFDVSYTADGQMASFEAYSSHPYAFTLTPTYDPAGRVQTLTCTAKWTDFTNVYHFRYEAGRIPGTDVDGMIGTDPSDPTIRLYYSQDNHWMGMSAVQDNSAEYKLMIDEQQRIQSLKIENTAADFNYDADGNLTHLQWSVSHSYVPLNAVSGDIVSSIGQYQILSQFSDLVFLLSSFDSLDTSFTLQFQYREGRLCGGSFITDSGFSATLVQTSSTKTSDSFNAAVAGETLQFPITIQYDGGKPREVSVDIAGYENESDTPVPLISGTFDEQGHEISTIMFDPDNPGTPVGELKKTWTSREK